MGTAAPWPCCPCDRCSSARRNTRAASSRCTPDQALAPSPRYADTPVARAVRMRIGTKPWSPIPCTDGGNRTAAARTPRSVTARAAASDLRKLCPAGRSDSAAPGLRSDNPDVTSNGRSEPSSALPSSSITRRSCSQFSANFEKSWLNAVWITASADFAACSSMSASSKEPFTTCAPLAASPRALSPERHRPLTWWLAAISSATTAEPTQPLAPVTKTCILFSCSIRPAIAHGRRLSPLGRQAIPPPRTHLADAAAAGVVAISRAASTVRRPHRRARTGNRCRANARAPRSPG